VGVYDELVAAPTATCFTLEELAWLRTIDAAAVSFITTRYPPPTAVACAILHGDLNFEHIRLLPNGHVYLFDFGDLCWGPVAHDLGQFLQCIYRDSSISFVRWAELRGWLVAGYTSYRSLTRAEIDAIDLFVINRIVAQAKYILELSGEEASPQGAAAIKHTYALAAHLVNKDDTGTESVRIYCAGLTCF
jgi:Ser/Thr protein kinase RdoA (MazF antagonist)